MHYPESPAYEHEFDNIPLTVLEHFDWPDYESEYEDLDGFRIYSKSVRKHVSVRMTVLFVL